MNSRGGQSRLAVLLLMLAGGVSTGARAQNTAAQEPICVENSPERRGEMGCSIVETKPLPKGLQEPLYWHIDRFDAGEKARAAVGPASIAFEANRSWWLMTVESRTDDHHDGEHVASVKLSPLPEAASYSFRVISSYLPPGMTSRVHLHSGPEAFYVLEGEQCLQTPDRAYPTHKGESLVVPTGVTMRMVSTGSKPRRAFAVIVYDSSKPPVTRMPNEKASELASCTK